MAQDRRGGLRLKTLAAGFPGPRGALETLLTYKARPRHQYEDSRPHSGAAFSFVEPERASVWGLVSG